MTKPWRCPELKGKMFKLGSTSALILIELKAVSVSGPFKKAPSRGSIGV